MNVFFYPQGAPNKQNYWKLSQTKTNNFFQKHLRFSKKDETQVKNNLYEFYLFVVENFETEQVYILKCSWEFLPLPNILTNDFRKMALELQVLPRHGWNFISSTSIVAYEKIFPSLKVTWLVTFKLFSMGFVKEWSFLSAPFNIAELSRNHCIYQYQYFAECQKKFCLSCWKVHGVLQRPFWMLKNEVIKFQILFFMTMLISIFKP